MENILMNQYPLKDNCLIRRLLTISNNESTYNVSKLVLMLLAP